MNPQHCLFVCTTCGSKWQNGQRIGTSAGEKLLAQLQSEHQNWELQGEFGIEPVSCMSACSRSCAIAFTGAGKQTYLFGDLPTDLSPPQLANIFSCADKYYQDPIGNLPWAERPEPLKQGLIAKIPPLSTLKVNARVAT